MKQNRWGTAANVYRMDGRERIRRRLIDEVRIHIVPLLLGGGTQLFDADRAELNPEGKPVTGTVTHLRFRVAKA